MGGGSDLAVVDLKYKNTSSSGSVQVGSYKALKDGTIIVCLYNEGPNRWPAVWVKKNGTTIFKQASSAIEIDNTDDSQMLIGDLKTFSWCKFGVKANDTITYGTEYDRAEGHQSSYWIIEQN